MSLPEKIEKKIFKISLYAGMVFVLAEFLMAVWSRSQTVLMDAAFDGAELVVIAISLLLTPLFYKPITEKRPFGYFQCESLFIIIKGFMMSAVTVSLISSNIQIMLDGGRAVDSVQIVLFEAALAAVSLCVMLSIRYYNKKISSPSAQAELYGWKVDFICSGGVACAFLLPPLLADSGFAWLAPYFDQLVAVVLALLMLPEPIRMIFAAFKSLLLFPPDTEVADAVRLAAQEVFTEYGYAASFVDVTQTGRKLWVAVTFRPNADILSMEELGRARLELERRLSAEYESLELELIPE